LLCSSAITNKHTHTDSKTIEVSENAISHKLTLYCYRTLTTLLTIAL
jgi:hypothetical protein